MATNEIQTIREHAAEVLARLERLLAGKAVDGLHLGDPGLTREWAERSAEVYRGIVR